MCGVCESEDRASVADEAEGGVGCGTSQVALGMSVAAVLAADRAVPLPNGVEVDVVCAELRRTCEDRRGRTRRRSSLCTRQLGNSAPTVEIGLWVHLAAYTEVNYRRTLVLHLQKHPSGKWALSETRIDLYGRSGNFTIRDGGGLGAVCKDVGGPRGRKGT